MRCKSCGAVLGEDAKFCSQCGVRVARCKGCGAVLEGNAKFCSQCGTRVEVQGASTAAVSAPEPMPDSVSPVICKEEPKKEGGQLPEKYETFVNTAESYQNCYYNFEFKREEKLEQWDRKDNIIEYKGKLFFCLSKDVFPIF